MSDIVIVGAGPAGLTAALELQRLGVRDVTVLEAARQVGGISRTVNHNGNRIDIGGHRFFSKSDWVMNWWTSLMPVSTTEENVRRELRYRGQVRGEMPPATAVEGEEDVMLLRNRLSRIYFGQQFFDYPLQLNVATLRKLGLRKTLIFGFSYLRARMFPIRPEQSLEDFLVNRFGQKLYRQFFKEYTEKVWGVPCDEISAEWGAQRIKSLSIAKALWHALRSLLHLNTGGNQQTSLIESFIYPKYGPGQMWEVAARRFTAQGGRLLMGHRVTRIHVAEGRVKAVDAVNAQGGNATFACSHLISTMPVRDLVRAMSPQLTPALVALADGLEYRDFITVGLLYRLDELVRKLDDNWIYIQEPGVQVGRVQVFNNWSPHMVAAPGTVWLGLEFFCREGDALWARTDAQLKAIGQAEMRQIGLVHADAAQDAVVIRVEKAYPGYFGDSYARFGELRVALDAIPNLFLIGRNGMHRYNNQDHSMLTAKKAAELLVAGSAEKSAIWDINVDDDYHEEK